MSKMWLKSPIPVTSLFSMCSICTASYSDSFTGKVSQEIIAALLVKRTARLIP